MKNTLKIFTCDLNFIRLNENIPNQFGPFCNPSAPHDWAFIDPKEYFDWHINFGNNTLFFQAYTFCGYAFYPTKLGPVAPGKGQELLPKLYEMCKKERIQFMSYFCVGTDLTMTNLREEWVVPGSRNYKPKEWHFGFLAPESPWTDLLCERVEEYLRAYPSEWIFLDWFGYGSIYSDYKVQPAWFVKKPFKEIVGREMPEDASEITPEENLKYKREVLAKQFYRLKKVINETSPETKILFNMPYWFANDPLWTNHPVMNESDMLFAECDVEDVMEWLLKVKKPEQRVMTMIIGRKGEGEEELCNPNKWEKWYSRGCDIMGGNIGIHPTFEPKSYNDQKEMEIIRKAFKKIK